MAYSIYKSYYDRNYVSSQKVPTTTSCWRKRKEKRKLNEIENIIAEKKSKIKNDTSDSTPVETPAFQNRSSFNQTLLQPSETFVEESKNLQNISKEQELSEKFVQRKRKKDEKIADRLQSPVCKCSNVNVAEVLLMSLTIVEKHACTWELLMDVYEMINTIHENSLLPTNKPALREMIGVDTESITYHLLCTKCDKYIKADKNLKNDVKCDCGTTFNASRTGSYFIELNVEEQLQNLFLDEKIVESLSDRFKRKKKNPRGLEDLYDGNVYKTYEKRGLLGEKAPWNFSYTMNTDGCQPSDASKLIVLPIFIELHELPQDLRKKHKLLAGLLVSRKEIDRNLFLTPFVKQANKLSTQGIKWHNKAIGKDIISKCFLLGCCLDSVERCAVLQMKRFNGVFGCTYCEHPGERTGTQQKYPMIVPPPIERTSNSIKEKMIEAFLTENNDVMGIKRPSVLMNVEGFDLVDGMILDFLHNACLGVAKLHTELLTSNCNEDYYIGSPDSLYVIEERLLAIRPPSCLGKVTKSFSERKYWTASDWLLWIVFYSLICLRGILRKKYYDHLSLFVAAMNILLQESITPDMIEKSNELLVKYVAGFELLFGKVHMNYNVHLLLHVPRNQINWGPAQIVNCFSFESENNKLLKMKKCNYRIALQIIYRLLTYQQIPMLANKDIISNRIKEQCKSFRDKRLKNFVKVGECILIGKGKNHSFSPEELKFIEEKVDVTKITEVKSFTKLIRDGCRYTICDYLRNKKRNDSVVETEDGRYGIVKNIYKISHNEKEEVFIFIERISVEQELKTKETVLAHIKIVRNITSLPLNLIEVSNLKRPSILVKSKKKEYFLITLAKGTLGRYVN